MCSPGWVAFLALDFRVVVRVGDFKAYEIRASQPKATHTDREGEREGKRRESGTAQNLHIRRWQRTKICSTFYARHHVNYRTQGTGRKEEEQGTGGEECRVLQAGAWTRC